MGVKNFFPSTLGCDGIDGNRRHAEATEEAQAAWDRALAANARNEREADARRNSIKKPVEIILPGCVFAKSCNLPDGVINHISPSGFVPVEKLADYGLWAVLGTGASISSQGTPLQLVGGSASGSAIAQRLGGSLSLGLLKGSGVAAGAALGTVALLIPNTSISPDSAFYRTDQYATLDAGRTRVRVNVKTLPDGSVNAYGFYTGGKTDWENVPVIKAEKDGENYVADIGNGIGLTWTPAASPDGVMSIPALEGAPKLPPVWVYPTTEQANKMMVNPVHPPDYQDAIITFPNTGIQPIYISLSVSGEHRYHPAPKGLTAFPDAARDKPKSSVQGSAKKRARWKDSKGRIYEWDSQHGAVEMYDKQGKHLGEYNPETGEQTKPAKPGRITPK
ncbi:S-type Pyocin [Pseudomonas sp. NFACC02]|uniref:colicin E3/pyocin S6 family cytotoxin n=1 Tax=Pseudomonas sp. NFACC02 TaxID=1566250 RepID=UPI0008BCD759|nr:colicin E3/pyocin S6 family cytotoxin [Pseudomonas sp. NFACC02]SER96767.1 S-type Pyocin [Pseudomonas sp. NFACC02]